MELTEREKKLVEKMKASGDDRLWYDNPNAFTPRYADEILVPITVWSPDMKISREEAYKIGLEKQRERFKEIGIDFDTPLEDDK